MGTITINMNDTVEHSFRALINKQSGTRKGSLAKAVEKALADFIQAVQKLLSATTAKQSL